MSFVWRSLKGMLIAASMIAMVGYGAMRFNEARDDSANDGQRRAQSERAFVVSTGQIANQTANPVITAYGEIRSWRTLEIRASAAGRLVEVSDALRDGASVTAGVLLFSVDPADAEARRADAEAAIDDIRAELAEAESAIALADQELASARQQKALRALGLSRQTQLKERGFGSDAAVEAAQMDLYSSEQVIIARTAALTVAKNRATRARLGIRRAEIVLANAERDLADTRVISPFDGILSDVNAVLGHLVSVNEKIATLMDPRALEVAFRVPNTQFARLVDEKGSLRPVAVSAMLDLGSLNVEVPGRVERAAASVGAGQTGRLIFARLDVGPDTILRDGDFVTVTIQEPPLANVARIPASAATDEGDILLVGADSRLEERRVEILRRVGDELLVAGAPEGAAFVVQRLPQLGAGILVRPRGPNAPSVAAAGENAGGGGNGDRISLTAERREALIAFVRGNRRMPEDRKARLINLINRPEVPRRVVDQIEQRMGQRS